MCSSRKVACRDLRTYALANFCFHHNQFDITPLLETPKVRTWFASQYVDMGMITEEPGLEVQKAYIDSVSLIQSAIRMQILDEICPPEEPLSSEELAAINLRRAENGEPPIKVPIPPAPNSADQVARSLLFSLTLHDRKTLMSEQYLKEAATLRAQFRSIMDGTFGETPATYDPFFLKVLEIYDGLHQAEETMNRRLADLLQQANEACGPVDSSYLEVRDTVLLPAMFEGFRSLASLQFPWQDARYAQLGSDLHADMRTHLQNRVSGMFDHLRIHVDSEGNSYWCSTIKDGQKV